jgi:hypothetical protein
MIRTFVLAVSAVTALGFAGLLLWKARRFCAP